MSPYTFGGLLIGFVVYSGCLAYAGYRYESEKCKAADEQATIAAYQHKDEVTTKQTAITTSEESTYEKDSNAIGTLYAVSLPVSPKPNLSLVANPPNGTCPSSKRYKLTPKQCDTEEAKLKALWTWSNQQAAVK